MSEADDRAGSAGADPPATHQPDTQTRSARLRERLGHTLRIARWEVSKSTGTLDRRTVIVLALLFVGVGVVGFGVADDGLGLEDGLYTVAIDSDDPYYPVAAQDDRFRIVDQDSNPDLIVRGGTQLTYVGETGDVAYDEFRTAVMSYNEQRMLEEPDQAAAFPVLVTLRYSDRGVGEFGSPVTAIEDPATDDDDLTDDESGEPAEEDTDSEPADDSSDPVADDPGEPADDSAADSERDDPALEDDEDGPLPIPDLGGTIGADQATPGTPGSLTAPFPFQSLVLAFLLILPMNFVIQVYGATIMNERLNRRGELLLVSPAGRLEIVAGKTLPYLVGLIGISVAIALLVGGGLLSIAAGIPIALAFLASTFAGAMFARSFKELTFVTVTISVVLTTYTFVPAIFSDVTPVALISPLTLIVLDLQGEAVQAVEYLFSTAAFYLGSAVLFALGIGVYREEDMFTQKPIPAKVIDAIVSQLDLVASRLSTAGAAFVLPIVFIPFVFGAQLLAVALLFAIPEVYALPVIILLAAAIEEVAKSLHLYAGFARSRFESSVRVAVVLGVVAGAGFFFGEKLTQVVQFVGLPELRVSVAAFGPALEASPLIVAAMFVAPLVLHVITAVVGALGASRGRVQYVAALGLATLLHAGYNYGVIALVG